MLLSKCCTVACGQEEKLPQCSGWNKMVLTRSNLLFYQYFKHLLRSCSASPGEHMVLN